jgi:DNA repair exonuclease SbcCD ATPase subunit
MKIINLRRVEAKNFMAIGDKPVVLNFIDGMTLIQGINLDSDSERSNASGKSTIIEAIFWAIFDKTLKNIRKKEHILNFTTKKNCEVILDFEVVDGNVTDKYRIIRGIKPDTLVFLKNGVDITLGSSKSDTNEHITRVMCGSIEVFRNCLIMSLGSSFQPFLEKESEERRKFVEGIFGIEFFAAAAKSVNEDIKIKKSELDSNVLTIQEQKNLLRSYTDNLNSVIEQNRVTEERKLYATESYDRKISEAVIFNSNIDNEIKQSFKKTDEKIYECEQRNKTVERRINEKKVELSSELAKASSKNEEIQQQIQQVELKYSRIRKEDEQRKIIDAEKQQQVIVEYKEKIRLAREEISNWNSKIEELRNTHLTERKELQTNIDIIKKKIERYDESNQKKLKSEAEDTLEKCKLGISKHNQKIAILTEDINRYTTEINELNTCTVCPTCGQPVSKTSDSHIKNEVDKRKAKIFQSNEMIVFENDCIQAKECSINVQSEFIELCQSKLQDVELLKQQETKLTLELSKLALRQEQSIPAYTGPTERDIESLKNEGNAKWKEVKTVDDNARELSYKNEIMEITNSKLNTSSIELKYAQEIETLKGSIVDVSVFNGEKLINEKRLNSTKIDVVALERDKIVELSKYQKKETSVFEELISNTNSRILVESGKFDVLSTQLSDLNIAKLVFSDDGARAYFLKTILDALNSRICSYIRLLGSNMHCIFDQYLDVTIVDDSGHDTTYKNLSGAERKTVDISLMLAFYSIKMAFGNVKYNCMFLDEVLDTSMDKHGVDLLVNLIKKITSENTLSTFVVSHRKEIANNFDSVMVIKKENGQSSLM